MNGKTSGTVLIADDHVIVRYIVKECLTSNGYDVETATDGPR